MDKTNNEKPAVGPKPGDDRSVSSILWGNFFIFLSTVFFGVNIPVVKILIPEWMTALDVTVFRLGGGCVLIWIASLFLKPDKIAKSDYLKVILGGTLGLFMFMFLFNMSLRYADPIDVSIIMTFPPVFVILIGILFQHKHTSLLEIAGVVVGFIGAFLVIIMQHSGEKGSDNILGDCLALASTLCYAFYLVILEGPTHRYRPMSLLRWVFLMACIPMLLLLPHFPQAPIFHTTDYMPWLCVAFIIICPTFLSYFLINPAIKMIGSELVSMYQYLLPVVAAVASVIMGVATLKWIQVIAMVVIIIGMLMTNKAKHKQVIAAKQK